MSDVLVKPAFQSALPDNGSPTQLGPNAWNAARLFSGGNDGEVIVRRAASATGAAWEVPGTAAAGTLTGVTLAANVLASSLTSLGTIAVLKVGDGSKTAPSLAFATPGNTGWYYRAGVVEMTFTGNSVPFQFGNTGVVNGGTNGYSLAAGAVDVNFPDVYLTRNASGQLNLTGFNQTNGVGLDFFTDSVLRIRTRAQTGDASISSLNHLASGYYEGTEMTPPSAGAVNTGRLYFDDNGSGKTRLMVIFNTGVAIQLAIQA